MTVSFKVCDVFDGLATLEDGSIDLVVTSPPLGLDALPVRLLPDAAIERLDGGSEVFELGCDTGIPRRRFAPVSPRWDERLGNKDSVASTLIRDRIALAYGINPLTGQESPAGRWRVRNVVTWCRPNPPPGALGDKWRPATSDVVVACTSVKRYWDDLATRKDTPRVERPRNRQSEPAMQRDGSWDTFPNVEITGGAPLLDYWVIPPTGYSGSHYAVYPPALVEPLVKAMCPQKVCRTCGEPSRRIIDYERHTTGGDTNYDIATGRTGGNARMKSSHGGAAVHIRREDAGFTDCGHDDYRPGRVLDPFAGSGTTLAVASGHGLDAIGIDLDERNEVLARERVGPLLWEGV